MVSNLEQRKALYGAIKCGNNTKNELMRHDEASVAVTVIGMAQDFVGSNDINLLVPSSGKSVANPRYLFTRLSRYVLVIPMVLINRADGIGTVFIDLITTVCWNTTIPNYSPENIVNNLLRMMDDQKPKIMKPWYRGFKKENIDYDEYNFIDEAGFNLHLRRTFGRSKKGQPAKEGVSNNRGVNVSILGAIAAEGITVMDVLEKNYMRGRIFIMDNASIHHSSIVKGTVENRGFHILYLPPYSPVLNLIEEFWSKLKACVKREILPTSNPFTPRTIQPTYLVTARDFQGWIRHAESYFPRCILEEPML
ncbi:hypothetical protein INT45_005651 [Circinella minor]|uniref:DNA topoisomerase (ATP-hydrolyzing) n=1 Tax=Circinella minor TaxID=1195481 RepID=A0A8H7RHI3_9FUNG|nr:hypothetical protein INT45_005651 [Circinella minor]